MAVGTLVKALVKAKRSRKKAADRTPEETEAHREWLRQDYAKNQEKILAKKRQQYQDDKEKIKEVQREAYWKRRDKVLEQKKELQKDPEYREKKKQYARDYRVRKKKELSETRKEKYHAAPEVPRELASHARAQRTLRQAPWADRELIQGIFRQADEVSRSSGIPHEVDHVIPLQGKYVSGLHHQDNLLIVPRNLNRSKSNSFNSGDDPLRMNDTARANATRLNEEYLNNNPEAVADAIARKLKLIKEQHGR